MTTSGAQHDFLSRTAWTTVIVAWAVNIAAVALTWRKVSAAPDGNVTAVILIAVFGFFGMLILTHWLWQALARVR
jgi:hypothetical protein